MAGRQVLVLGGTGFLGRRLALAFAWNGDSVAVLARGKRLVDRLPGVELLPADRHDAAGLRAALAGRSFNVVVDNIAFTGDDVATLLATLDGRVEHYLLTSSAAVYAERYVRRPLCEHEADLSFRLPIDAPNPFHPRLGQAYANGKRAAEQVTQRGDVPWTILRPPVVVGADDRTRRVWWFVQRLLDGEPLLIPQWGAGRVFQVGWTDDIARATVAAAGNARAFGNAYNVAQAEIYTAESWIEAAANLLGVKPAYACFPEEQSQRLGLPDYSLPVAGRPFGHLLLDLSAIRCDLGFEPSPEAVWLGDTLRGCASNPPAEPSPGYERRADEIRVARTLLAQQ